LGRKDAPKSPDSQENKSRNIFLDNNYYCLKCEPLPENISGFFFFFVFLFSFVTYSQIWLIPLVDDPHFLWVLKKNYYCLNWEHLPENISGFLLSFFSYFPFLRGAKSG